MPKSAQLAVATLVRSIFAQPDAESVRDQHGRLVAQLEERFPEVAALLDDAAAEALAFTGLPNEHWRQLWSNNSLERLNKQIRRRTDVVGIFPNRSAIGRLVGAVLAEQRRVGRRPPRHERRVDRQRARRARPRARGGGGHPSSRLS